MPLFLALLLLLFGNTALSQTSLGLIAGRVYEAPSGRPVEGLRIQCEAESGWFSQPATTDSRGAYAVPQLPPGSYRLRIDGAGVYQDRVVLDIEIGPGGRVQVDIPLRLRGDVYSRLAYRDGMVANAGAVIHTYAADLNTKNPEPLHAVASSRQLLESSVSFSISRKDIDVLPLAGRDAYGLLLLLPGTVSETGTARGLNVSTNGQRPSSANYLLDGLEFNNMLLSGPLAPIPPEIIQEYRVATSHFSAEYGGASGFLANAVTSGQSSSSSSLHLLLYNYLKRDSLNAINFPARRLGFSKAGLRENQTGFLASLGIFTFAGEQFRFRTQREPVSYWLPTRTFLNSLASVNTTGARLLREFPAAAVPESPGEVAPLSLRPTLTQHRNTALLRVSPVLREHRLFLRFLFASLFTPDFLYSPYARSSAPLLNDARNYAAGWTYSGKVSHELRLSASSDRLSLDTTQTRLPVLQAGVLGLRDTVTLPGPPSIFGYRNQGRNREALSNLTLVNDRLVLKLGGGFFHRHTDSRITSLSSGLLQFESVQELAGDSPDRYFVAAAKRPVRADASGRADDFLRYYSYRQFHLFGHTSFRLTPRVNLNLGARLEYFGSPQSRGGTSDLLLEPSALLSLSQARLVPSTAGRPLFTSGSLGIAPRIGISVLLDPRGDAVLRAGYGLFRDRPFENIWQNVVSNSFDVVTASQFLRTIDVRSPAPGILRLADALQTRSLYDRPIVFQQALSPGRTHTAFGAWQRRIRADALLEVTGTLAVSRGLLTTDRINRMGSITPLLPELVSRSALGEANHAGMSVALRHRGRWLNTHVSYTLSRTRDEQTDALFGEYLDLSRYQPSALGRALPAAPAFTREASSRLDRAPSGFDQRHSLLFQGYAESPKETFVLTRNWRFGAVASARSGTPFSVLYTGPDALYNNRPNWAAAVPLSLLTPPPDGGRRLVNPDWFSRPAIGEVGNVPRNAFHGPGSLSADASLSRTFSIPAGALGLRLTLRADCYNLLNHANFGNPVNLQWTPSLGSSSAFGVAYPGRLERPSGFPLQTPASETARQFQLMVRFEF
ncbi:MAG: carboxypeptidase regulatory-like domain-containing protein [Bryobacterales bacterium]|nr:carboxypeptidase regulatory-like domain-containing protein [Bryobacterales bacterium]